MGEPRLEHVVGRAATPHTPLQTVGGRLGEERLSDLADPALLLLADRVAELLSHRLEPDVPGTAQAQSLVDLRVQ